MLKLPCPEDSPTIFNVTNNAIAKINTVMATYYDDNFGHYNIESAEDVEFYHQVQRESQLTTFLYIVLPTQKS